MSLDTQPFGHLGTREKSKRSNLKTDYQIQTHELDSTHQQLNLHRAHPTLKADTESPIRLTQRYFFQVLRTSLPLVAADLLALGVGIALFYGVATMVTDRSINHVASFWATVWILQVVVFAQAGLYPSVGVHPAVELRQLTHTWFGLGMAAFGFVILEGTSRSPYVILAAGTFGTALLLSPVLRASARAWASRRLWWGYPTVMIGNGRSVEHVNRVLANGGGRGLRLRGRFDNTHRFWNASPDECDQWLGNVEDALRYARKNDVHWLVIALPEYVDPDCVRWIQFFRQRFRHIVIVHSQHELPSLWNQPLDFGGLSAVQVEERLMMPEQQWAKRLFDFMFVFTAGICLFPLLILLALIVWITSGRPVFYCNHRIGRHGKAIRVWKFRTMVRNSAEMLQQYLQENPIAAREFEETHKLKHDPRITWCGRFLRRTSLDELPQILNVLTGQMSLVGPRPIVSGEIAKYGETYRDYTRVPPGITGLWQVSGRNNTTYQERLMYDRFYVRNWSPWLDLYILGRTIKTVLYCEGAY